MSKNQLEISRRDILRGGAMLAAGTMLGMPLAADEVEASKKPSTKPVPQVPRRILGKTNESIPILLFGASMRLNQVFDPRLAEAFRYGINYIDAADCYAGGTCETAVGAFHKRMNNRDKLWITSKSDAHDPAGFEKTLDQTLRALQSSYVDMYYLHALRDKSYLSSELEKKVAELKKAKKIRFFGFACHGGNVVELMTIAATLPWIDSIMFRYNFRQYGNKELNRAIDACYEAKIGLIAMKTQAAASSFEPQWKRFRKKGQWNKYQAVLKAVWADPRITAAVSHMDTFKKLRENIAAAIDPAKLTRAEIEELRRYASMTRSIACDGCDHICNEAMGGNVPIGDLMRYLMYRDVYGQAEEAQTLLNSLSINMPAIAATDFSPAMAVCPCNIDLNHHLKQNLIIMT